MSIELITGPARSGKSRWAEQLLESGPPSPGSKRLHYLATGPQLPDDPQWQARLQRHRERRPGHWHCIEVGFALVDALKNMGPSDQVLIDSLGTWVSQGLELEDSAWRMACDQLLWMLESSPARLLLVSEQAGWGVVPATAIAGLFRDRLGELEERIGRRCCQLWLVVAGRAVDLLPISQPIPPS